MPLIVQLMRDQSVMIPEITESKMWQPLYREVLPKGLFVYILIITDLSVRPKN
jgi:hypothetical protein